jgi:hypothetical protein
MRSFLAAGAAVSILLAAAATARATVIVPVDFNELTAAAEAIVYARVTGVRAVLSDDRRRVESIVAAEAIGYMKGDLGRSFAFSVPGGQVGAYRTFMVGAPVFEPGEEVVLFFGRRPAAATTAQPFLVGFSQGVFRVRVDARTGGRVVVPPPALNTGQPARLRRGSRAPMPLDSFAAQVKVLVSGRTR